MTKLIVANWKMHGSKSMINEYNNIFTKYTNTNIKLIICPPYPLLQQTRKTLKNIIEIGAQNCSDQECGAFTGEVSCKILKELGCNFVIIGHTERRTFYQETPQTIKNKINIAIKNNMQPIVCVYKEDHHINKNALNDIINQCKELNLQNTKNAIIAYEPKWAIGTNTIPNSYHIESVLNTIKETTSLPTLYGGSVNENNINKLINISDGLLIGGMSIKISTFYKALKSIT